MKRILRYLKKLSTGKIILWCYLIWYLVVLARYFDPNPSIWLTSFGLSVIIGIALWISSTTRGNKLERWQNHPLVSDAVFRFEFRRAGKWAGFYSDLFAARE